MDTGMRVWWIPQLGMKQVFHVPVKNVDEAKLIMKTLANYDLFQFKNRIKPDYANVGGLEVQLNSEEWEDWNDDEGRNIDEVMRAERR